VTVLLVDIGNSRLKWVLWNDGRLGHPQACSHADWSRRDFERHFLRPSLKRGLERIIVSSVAAARVGRAFAAAARRATGLEPEFLATERRAAGITTRYFEPWRLGVDRFLGAIGAHHLAGRRAVCVVGVGTAVTIDLIDGRGIHRGGAILPGPELMVRSLLEGTAGIARRAREPAGAANTRRSRTAGMLFARSTRAAIERGALHAAAAAIDQGVVEARRIIGAKPLVVLTGGGASYLQPLLHSKHLSVPDLVLRGIAVRAGLGLKD